MDFKKIYKILLVTGLLCTPFLDQEASSQDQDTESQLKYIQGKIEQSEDIKDELNKQAEDEQQNIKTLTEAMVETARDIQNQEAILNQTEDEAYLIEGQQIERKGSLRDRSEDLLKTLAALQKLSQRPPKLVLLKPNDAIDTIRSASLLATILPAIQKAARLIKGELGQLKNLKSQLLIKKTEISFSLNTLGEKKSSLNETINKRKSARAKILTEVNTEARRIANLAQEAQNLQSLLKTLNAEKTRRTEAAREAASRGAKPDISREPTPTGQPISKARGSLALPVMGQVIERFGSTSQVGDARGIRIATRKGAQVVAPFDGRVVYAGPFRTYGQLLIIDHGEGYHTLLAGMTILGGEVGQWVLEGEPIGTMDSENINGVSLGATSRKPELYVELRQNGNPENPLPWMAKRTGKAIGQ